ncbi:outer membrane protein [Modicisalibacter ilicicola DSM 19980]|uniref:Outer membrane protein n=1 Tax=Modicisalibacter ilicicola DSM 19980 TaxID=1121942 RepID=A0A1M5BEG9_9GAMM|nr:OmpW family outer membrane protein [Halomonas ilicicola]SHF40838.1 outer membrane protein [Halomonas ilicicola DSM 19980]
MRITPLLTGAVFLASMTAASSVMAYGQGDFYTRFGVAKVEPKSDNGDFDDLGLDVDVDDDSAFAFTLGYRFTDVLGVELLAAERFEHDINLGDTGIDASTKHLPPTLTLQYYPFGGTDARVQPYVGAGINYTRFSDEELEVGDLELDNSWGYAAQLGVDLLISEHWALNAAAWYLDIDSDATATIGGVDYDADVEIDPVVVMGGLSFRF